MKPTPEGWPRISSAIFYRDAGAMIDWLCAAFGFEIRLKIEGERGRIEHSELTFGDDGVVMVGPEQRGSDVKFGMQMLSPFTALGNTQSLMLYVDDVEAHCEQRAGLARRLWMNLQCVTMAKITGLTATTVPAIRRGISGGLVSDCAILPARRQEGT